MVRQLKTKPIEGISLIQHTHQQRAYYTSAGNLGNQIANIATHEELSNDDESVSEQHSVNKKYLGRLIGKGGSNLNRLTTETNTKIHIHRETGTLTIRGAKENIALAKAAIDKVTGASKPKRERPTHFLSLPVHSDLFHQRVKELSGFCLQTKIDPETLLSTQNLHITLGVMRLLNEDEVDKAVKILQEECSALISKIVKDDTVTVKLDTLKIMQSNPKKTRVLYVDPKDLSGKGLFNNLCSSVIEKMISVGLLERENRPFKPHVTLINTSHSKRSHPFDATPILKEFEQVDFGSAILNELHLMKMGRTGPNKTYESKGFITFHEIKQ